MASAELLDELSCSICLNIYTEPVSLRCGHNFCRVCIERVLDTQKGYSCPECREQYAECPLLEKNRKLCNIAKYFHVMPQLKASEVTCTYCVHAPIRAAKTCLQCETSLCDVHLSIHNRALDHVLIEPVDSLVGRKCQTHNKLLEYHCGQDAACICGSCFAVGSHRMHEVETLDEAMRKKKEKLRKVLDVLTTQVGGVGKQIQNLLDLQAAEHGKATGVKKEVTSLFEYARKQLEEKEAWIMEAIYKQEDQVDSKISYLVRGLEKQKESALEKVRRVEELCEMTDPLLVLQDKATDGEDFVGLEEPDMAEKADDEEDIIKMKFDEGLITASLHVAFSDLGSTVKKAFYIRKTVDLLLDPDTAANQVLVSGDLKSASWMAGVGNKSLSSTRFLSFCQVFTKNSFCKGQHYWEVDTSESAYWMVGLAYPSIPRAGTKSKIGSHENSWCLKKSEKGYRVIRDSLVTALHLKSPIQTLGIYLDYEAGYLAFYQLCDSARLLCTFHSTFTEPLHPAFVVWKDGWIRIRS